MFCNRICSSAVRCANRVNQNHQPSMPFSALLTGTDGAKKEKRPPTLYNIFMKNEIARLKAADPSLAHKEAFKSAAGNWKFSDENPKKV